MTEPYENQNEQPAWSEPVRPQNEQPTWTPNPNYYYVPPKKEKTGWSAGLVVTVTLVCSLLAGALGAGSMYLVTKLDKNMSNNATGTNNPSTNQSTTILEGNRENVVIDITKIDTTKVMTQAEVYAANVNSTVGITTSITTNYWGWQMLQH